MVGEVFLRWYSRGIFRGSNYIKFGFPTPTEIPDADREQPTTTSQVVLEWCGLLFWCDSAAGKAAEERYWKAEGLWSSDEEEEDDVDHRRN